VDESESSYREQLGSILLRRDPTALQRFLIESAERYGDERQVADVRDRSLDQVEELMHRMILARPDLEDLHRESRDWLSRHGVNSPPPDGARRSSRTSTRAPKRG
jgi:hypothetical protein